MAQALYDEIIEYEDGKFDGGCVRLVVSPTLELFCLEEVF